MGTKDVISTGLSFLVVVVVLHLVVAIIWGIGFGLFEAFATEECNEWGGCYSEYSDASWIFALLFWIPAGIILICGYIGLWTKLFTDSIAMGVYKANNAGEDALLVVQSAPATTVVSAAPMASVAAAPMASVAAAPATAQQPIPVQQQQPQDPQQNAMVLENQYQQ